MVYQFSSVVQWCLDSLRPHEPQHARPPCPSPTPRAYPNACPLSWWCHNHLILCHALLLSPSIFPSIRVFSNESFLHIRWPKYWNFRFSISPSNEHPGLTSFRMVYSPHFTFLPLTLSCMWGLWPSYVCGILVSIKLNLIFSCYPVSYHFRASLMALLVKNPPAMQETWVQSLGWEDPLEKGKATHSSILAWLQRARHDWATFTSV